MNKYGIENFIIEELEQVKDENLLSEREIYWINIILEFSERHDESIYFDSDEEMEGWLESFRQEFGKPFMYIE